jgi:MFS transporter, DHA2 family, multidrug resistance protein
MVNQQAQIIAYADDYVMLICTILPSILLLLFMRRPLRGSMIGAEPVE